jgi:hypothetical protein
MIPENTQQMTCDELRSAMSGTSGRKAFDAHLVECDACLSWSIDQVLAQAPVTAALPLFAERVMREIAARPAPIAPSRIATRVAVAAVAVATLAAAPFVTSFDAPMSDRDILQLGVVALGVVETFIVVGWALTRQSVRVIGFR